MTGTGSKHLPQNNETKVLQKKGSAAEYVLYFKCHRIYYNTSIKKYNNLYIFCDTCLQYK